jgi:hypothetical protein
VQESRGGRIESEGDIQGRSPRQSRREKDEMSQLSTQQQQPQQETEQVETGREKKNKKKKDKNAEEVKREEVRRLNEQRKTGNVTPTSKWYD